MRAKKVRTVPRHLGDGMSILAVLGELVKGETTDVVKM